MKVFFLIIPLFSLLVLVLAAPNVAHLTIDDAIHSRRSPRIVGGHEATPHSIPYQAKVVSIGTTTWFCGGVLISSSYVITTADCLTDNEATQVYGYLGLHYLNPQTGDGSESFVSRDFTIHEDFNGFVNNIAVIKFLPVELTHYIQPVFLPTRSESNKTFVGALADISGWGVVDDTGAAAYRLQVTQVTVISNALCLKTLNISTSDNICTSFENGYSNSGDDGGPLVTNNELIGIQLPGQSHLSSTARAHTRITTFLDWLERNTDVVIE